MKRLGPSGKWNEHSGALEAGIEAQIRCVAR